MINLIENRHRDGINRSRTIEGSGCFGAFHKSHDIRLPGSQIIVDHQGGDPGQSRFDIAGGIQLLCLQGIYQQPTCRSEGWIPHAHGDLSDDLSNPHG